MHHLRCHNTIGKFAAAVPYGRAFLILPGPRKKQTNYLFNQLTYLLTNSNSL